MKQVKDKQIRFVRVATVPLSLKFLMAGQMRYMSDQGFDVSMISSDGPELADVLEYEQCPHEMIPMTRAISPVADAKCLWQFIKYFRKVRPHIIHTHTPKAGLLGMIAGRICRVPVRVHTLAGWRLLNESGWRRKLLYWVEKITFWCAHEVWPNSHTLHKLVIDEGFEKDARMNVIGHGSSNGVDTAEYSARSIEEAKLGQIKDQIQYDSNKTYLLCVGRIVVEKGIEELVRGFCRVKESHPNIKLVLAGDWEDHIDPVSQETRRVIEEDDDILAIGFTNDVKYFLHLCDMLVHPSHREGLPNVILQAGAMSCPVVCSNIGGNIDLVKHDETGIIFDVKNEDALVEGLERALANREELDRFGAGLHQEICSNFARSSVHRNLYAGYCRLIRERLPNLADALSPAQLENVGNANLAAAHQEA